MDVNHLCAALQRIEVGTDDREILDEAARLLKAQQSQLDGAYAKQTTMTQFRQIVNEVEEAHKTQRSAGGYRMRYLSLEIVLGSD